jgi:uncharacterized protein (DUF433 family)
VEQQSEKNKGFSDEGDGFDSVAFSREIFNSIKSSRSNVGSFPSLIVDSPLDTGKGGSAENMLNTFYRLIGLPAIRDEGRITNDPKFQKSCDNQRRDNALSQGGTLNYFSVLNTPEGFAANVAAIGRRDSILNEQKTADKFNTMLTDPLPIDESTKFIPRQRRRPSLFPLLVDASIPVYSMSRRVAPLFNDGDYVLLGGQSRLRRPFLQHVIYMRMKVFSGQTTVVEDEIRTNILNEVGEGIIEESALKDYLLLELKIIQKLIQALKRSSKGYIKARNEAKKLGTEVLFIPAPVDDPKQRGGSSSGNATGIDVLSDLDIQLQRINVGLNLVDLFLQTLPIEELNRSDKIRRIEDEITIRNTSPDAFMSEFISLISYERKPLEQEKSRVVAERKRVIQKAEKVREALQYYTGEFTGLSIFDVISVFYGLFTVDKESLIALLNQSAQERLLDDPFFVSGDQATDSISNQASIQDIVETLPSISEALTNLEAKVNEGFSIARAFQERTTRTNKTPPAPVESTKSRFES